MRVLSLSEAEQAIRSDRIRIFQILTLSPGSDTARGLLLGIASESRVHKNMIRIETDLDPEGRPVLNFKTYDESEEI